MNAFFVVKVIVFVIALIASRVILARASKHLNERQKEQIAAASAKTFLIRRFLIIGLVAANAFLLSQPDDVQTRALPALSIAFIAAMVLLLIVNFVQVKRLDPPKPFINIYLISVFVLLAGIAFLFAPF